MSHSMTVSQNNDLIRMASKILLSHGYSCIKTLELTVFTIFVLKSLSFILFRFESGVVDRPSINRFFVD